jgi:hypothetical protein
MILLLLLLVPVIILGFESHNNWEKLHNEEKEIFRKKLKGDEDESKKSNSGN